MTKEQHADLPLIVLRYGMALVFVWFAWAQFANPAAWFSFLPAFTTQLPISQTAFVLLNAWLETVAVVLLLAGFWTRPVAALLGLHLLAIAATAGGPIGVRDFGLGVAAIALALGEADFLTTDRCLSRCEAKV